MDQVQEYFGRTLLYEEFGHIECAYLVDLDQNGSEELVLFYATGGSGCLADSDIWRKQKLDTSLEQLLMNYLGRMRKEIEKRRLFPMMIICWRSV